MLAAGVRFRRTDKGGLGYDDPNGAMTRDDWRAFSGLHEAMIEELARRRAAAAAEKERAALLQDREDAEARASRAERAVAALRSAFARMTAWWMRRMSARASQTRQMYRDGLAAAGVEDAGALAAAGAELDRPASPDSGSAPPRRPHERGDARD